jgi:putative isomerase
MFFKPWREKAVCRENFLATTGAGSSDPHYTWGALMALIAVEELIDINPWHGLRFGNLEPIEAAGLERYPVGGALYDVQLSDQGLTVKRDGKSLFTATVPVEIRQVQFRNDRVQCEVRAGRPGQLRIGTGQPRDFATGLAHFEGRFPCQASPGINR